MRAILTAGLLALALAGCSAGTNVEDQWQCPMANGAQCKPIEDVDPYVVGAAATVPALHAGQLPPPVEVPMGGTMLAGTSGVWPGAGGPVVPVPVKAKKLGRPVWRPGPGQRSGDSVARMYVFPYVDKGDNYHEGEFLDVVVRHSHWIAR